MAVDAKCSGVKPQRIGDVEYNQQQVSSGARQGYRDGGWRMKEDLLHCLWMKVSNMEVDLPRWRSSGRLLRLST